MNKITDISLLDEKMVEYAIRNHIKDYSSFMNDVLELEQVFGMKREDALVQTLKRYPQFVKN